jgi:hypothetical protein
MVRRFVHFEVICTAKYRYGEQFLHRKLNSIFVREIRHQRINNYLQTVLVRGKIAGPGLRYLFTSGLPTSGIFRLKSKYWGSFEKRSGHFLDQYLDF